MSLAFCPKGMVRCIGLCLMFVLCLKGSEGRAFAVTSGLPESARVVGNLEAWLKFQTIKSQEALLANISPPGSMLGAISASPSRFNPDYYYHWVRDGAIVMGSVVNLYEKTRDEAERGRFFKLLADYVDFSQHLQTVPNLSGGLGEPKFRMDGTAYNEDWGRPQNDGPALRAITLIRLAQDLLISSKNEFWVRSKLYDGALPSSSVIKADLEYVSNHWRDSSFDLWEEVRGAHFFTKMVQRKSLIDGAFLADRLGDSYAATWYRSQAKELEIEIDKHWYTPRGYLVETLDRMYGAVDKQSGLDVAILLGAIQGNTNDGFYSVGNDRILATIYKLRDSFRGIYPINSNASPNLAPAIGRYPEDIYDGYSVGGTLGNPWFLATTAYAELYFRLVTAWNSSGTIPVTPLNLPFMKELTSSSKVRVKLVVNQSLVKGTPEFDQVIKLAKLEGDRYLARVMFHAADDGSLSEQINRYTGFMQGARDLSWSYSSFLSALWEREDAASGLSSRD